MTTGDNMVTLTPLVTSDTAPKGACHLSPARLLARLGRIGEINSHDTNALLPWTPEH